MQKEEFKNLVLETLSFFEEMTVEKIILDFDAVKIRKLNDFTKDDLESVLDELVKAKKVKKIKSKSENKYIKLRPLRGWRKWLRIFNL